MPHTMDCHPDDLLSEDDVYKRYGHLLAERELREARKNGLIEFFDLRKGIYYTVAQVMDYLNSHKKAKSCEAGPRLLDPEKEAPSASSKSATIGSVAKKGARTSIITGMTPALEERAASLLDAES